MKKQVTISIIGAGRLGGALAKAIEESKQFELHSHIPARSKSFAKLGKNNGPQVLFVVTKDDQIKKVAAQAVKKAGSNLQIIIHCAGSLSPDILPKLKGVDRLTLHPIQSIADAKEKSLKRIAWMICTDSKAAMHFAKDLVSSLDAIDILKIKPLQLPLYHAITVFASNFAILLIGAVELMSASLKIDKKRLKSAIAPLMKTSLENALADDAKKVLTGPIARKDLSTILKHRIALKKQPRALRKIYEAFLQLADEL